MPLLRQLAGNDGQVGEMPSTRQVVLAEMEAQAPILQYAQFYPIVGNADTLQAAAATTAGEMRAVGGADFTSATTSVSDITSSLRIMGDVIQTDLALTRRGYTAEDFRLSEVRKFSRSFGRYFFDRFINGTNVAPQIYGLKEIAIAGAASQTISTGTDGLLVELGNSDAKKKAQQQFIEKLDELLAAVNGGADCIVMSAAARARLTAIAREYVTVTRTTDAFGREQTLATYYEVPIVIAGYAADGTTAILPSTETQGASTDCQSIYAMKFGERDDLSLPTSVGLVVKDEGLVGNMLKTRIELDLNVFPIGTKSFARMTGVRLG